MTARLLVNALRPLSSVPFILFQSSFASFAPAGAICTGRTSSTGCASPSRRFTRGYSPSPRSGRQTAGSMKRSVDPFFGPSGAAACSHGWSGGRQGDRSATRGERRLFRPPRQGRRRVTGTVRVNALRPLSSLSFSHVQSTSASFAPAGAICSGRTFSTGCASPGRRSTRGYRPSPRSGREDEINEKLGRLFFGPSGAAECSHGWSGAADRRRSATRGERRLIRPPRQGRGS